MGHIADAHRRWHAFGVSSASSASSAKEPRCAPPLTCDQLSAALATGDRHGPAVESCQVWRTNWRNRIYRITLRDGTVAVAKQACIPQDRELQCEFSALERLAALRIRHLQVPAPIAYLAPLQAYLMEMAPGVSLDCLLRKGRTRDFLRACGLAGRVLARVHNGWNTGSQPLPVDALAADLFSIPLRFSHGQRQIIHEALGRLSDSPMPIGQPYLDFKASNVLFDGGSIWLIDPPEEDVGNELLAWDLAVFTVSVDHELWKCMGRGNWKARKAVSVGVSQFLRAYRRHLSGPRMEDSEFHLALHLVQLQRVGQLIALQKSKLNAGCRRRIPFTSVESRLVGAVANGVSLPVLKAHAHFLIGQTSRIVRHATARNTSRK